MKKLEMIQVGKFLKDMPKIEKYPIRIIFTWHIKRANSDLDNKSVKVILDEMQKQGILENDNIKYIQEIRYIAVHDKEDYVEMEIEEI